MMMKITIKTNILTVFLSLVGVVALSLLLSQYYFSEKLAIESTTKTFSIITQNISEHLRKESVVTHDILNAKRKHQDILEPVTFNPFHPSLKSLIQILQIKNNIYAIYFAQENGAFYEVVNMRKNPVILQAFDAPSSSQWAVITIINSERQYAFLDKDLKLISKRKSAKKYDPRNRPWYKKAVDTKGIVTTDPYLFSNLNHTGVTYAVELNTKGTVLALDYTMEQLNEILALQKFDKKSEIFLVDRNGKKFASSDFSVKEHHDGLQTSSSKRDIHFTEKEKAYIKNHTTLLVSNEEAWAPFDFEVAGEPKGYSIDLLHLIGQRSGLNFQFSNGYQWAEIMDMFQKGNLDMVHSLYKTPQREEMGLFTKPIYSFKNYFIVSKDEKEIQNVADIQNKKVVVVKGWSTEEYMKQNYPNISCLTVESAADAFLALSRGRADVMIDTKESFHYISRQLHIKNLKLSGWFKEFDDHKAKNIYIMIQKNESLLLSILNKTLGSLTQRELKDLHIKWFKNSDNRSETMMLNAELMQVVLDQRTDKIIKYKQGENHYYALFNALSGNDGFMGIKIDADELLKPYKKNMQYSLFIAFILLLLALPVVFLSAGHITKPIKALILENNKIKERKFSDVKKIDTNIIELEDLSNSLVSMSGNIQKHEKDQDNLLDSIIKLIAEAIDKKSPYTGKHCERVPQIAFLLLDAANSSTSEAFKAFSFTSEDERREFEIGAWLHDCGKVTTPAFVVDKSVKLETIYNRIHEIRMRFEVLWRDAQIAFLQKEIDAVGLKQREDQLLEDFEFIASVNVGTEFMGDEKRVRVKEIAKMQWERHFDDRLGLGYEESRRYKDETKQALPVTEDLLSNKAEHIVPRDDFDHTAYAKEGFRLEVPEYLYNYGEIYNLCVERGTLTDEERYKINEHVIMSIKMLEKIPFPETMKNVVEYAGTHHETLIGTGYPRKLTGSELSIPARIMAIADIFEALTASDRPYKKSKTVSEAIHIMSLMVKDQHIDKDLFELFLNSGVYKNYAQKYLETEQIDEVDVAQYLS